MADSLLMKVDIKPEGLEDSFFDSATGEINVANLITSYREARTKMNTREDEIRDAMNLDRLSGRPADPAGYDFKLPDNFDMPEGVKFNLDQTHPLVSFWRQHAWDSGFGQKEFEAGIGSYFDAEFAQMPDYDEEIERLGERGKERVDRVNSWLKSVVTADQLENIGSVVLTAGGIEAMEAVIDKAGAPSLLGDGGAPPVIIDSKNDHKGHPEEYQAETDRMMMTSEYQQNDPDMHAAVTARFKAAEPGMTNLNSSESAPAPQGTGSEESAGAGDQ
jgi:hypothetical protein